MDSPLTPELALSYLRELSLDVRSAIVVDANGRRLAGAAGIAASARALLGVPEAAVGLAVRTSDGWVFGERSDAVGVVVVTGPLVLAGLIRHDIAEVVGLLGGARRDRRVVPVAPSAPAGVRVLAEDLHRALAPVAPPGSEDS